MTMIRYAYKDPKEMSAFKVLKEGEGTFKILEIKTGFSKAGNEQLIFTYRLTDSSGDTSLYINYMPYNEYMAENIWRICEAIGRPELYSEQGTNPIDLVGHSGRCKIKTEVSEQYGDKSRINRFIPYKPIQEDATSAPAELPDDPLPF